MTCYIVCTCTVSHLYEWGSASSNRGSEEMTCYTLGNCTSWPQYGSACAGKAFSCLQMSSDTGRKIIAQTSSKLTSYPLRISAPTAIILKQLKYRSKHHFPFQKHQNSLHLFSITMQCTLYIVFAGISFEKEKIFNANFDWLFFFKFWFPSS